MDEGILTEVPESLVNNFFRALGVKDLDDVLKVTIEAGKVIVEQLRRHPDGEGLVAAGRDVATVITTIGITDD